ncbi:MAG: DVUA0089 family protein [Undibacterium sp.]|nr:DVUA0089 family protein [Opitutaceae bacterium]
MVAANDNWLSGDAAAMNAVGAFPLTVGSADAGIVTTLAARGSTTPVSTPGNGTGITLIECYDGAPNDTSVRLVNASARAYVGTGEDVLIPGFVITGEGTVRLLVRAVGPGLTAFGVPGALADPQLTLYKSSEVLATNDNWSSAANPGEIVSATAAAGGFALVGGSKDAALVVTLGAGAYTALVSGVGNTTGTALVEIYVLP